MSVPAQFLCSLTGLLMVDPIFLAPCGHHFDRSALPTPSAASAAKNPNRCPICHEEIISMAPARALKELMDAWSVRSNSPARHSPPMLAVPHHLRGDLDPLSRPQSGDFKVPVHLSPCDRRRSQQFSSSGGSPAVRPLQPGWLTSPEQSFNSPHGCGRASNSINGPLESFTFGLPPAPSSCEPSSPMSNSNNSQDLKVLEDQLRSLEEVGRRNSPVWNIVNDRLIELRNRRNTMPNLPPSHTMRLSVDSTAVRSGPSRNGSGDVGGVAYSPTHNPQRTMSSSSNDDYSIAVQQLSNHEVVWSPTSAARKSPLEGFDGFTRSFRRFVKGMAWHRNRLPRETFLASYRTAIDRDAVAPRCFADPVHTAFRLWKGDVFTTDQMGRVLELKSLPLSLATFHHLLEESVSHAKCPISCAGRRYFDHHYSLTLDLSQTVSQERSFEPVEGSDSSTPPTPSNCSPPSEPELTDHKSTRKREKFAAFFTAKAQRATSLS